MCDAARQSTNGLHFLRLEKLLFKLFAVGDIARDTDDAYDHAGFITPGCFRGEHDPWLPLMDDGFLKRLCPPRLNDALVRLHQGAGNLRGKKRGVVIPKNRCPWSFHYSFGDRVDHYVPPREVFNEDRFGGAFHHCVEQEVVLAKDLFPMLTSTIHSGQRLIAPPDQHEQYEAYRDDEECHTKLRIV